MKKLIIIGAGVAGLTCGVYARINGFETDIYELHTVPGGECTGWDRKGYHFDGCLHWLVGSKPGPGLHEVWRDTGALDDTVNIIHYDVFTRYEENGAFVNIYTDADKLERHFNEISPEDRHATAELCKAVRKFASFGMPVEKPMDMMTASDGLKFAAKNIGNMGLLGKYSKLTVRELAAGFKSPLLRSALLASFSGDYPSIALLSTLGGMNAGDCGFPAGGSRAFARRMEAHFLSLGGKVHYKSRVDKILVEDGSAVGIRLADGQEARADEVISCGDGYDTLVRLLDSQYTPEIYRKLLADPVKYPTITCALVFAGVEAELPYEHRSVVMRRETSVTLGGVEADSASILHFGFDPSLVGPGKTVLASFYGADYDFWDEAAKDPARYAAEKKKLEDDAVAVMLKRYPGAEGKIAVTDVVTPKTYERFCNAWRGAWMTWSGKDVPQYHPGVLPGLRHFIMAGMWTMPPGGLPGAAAAGRFAAHRLCAQNGMEFRTK